MGNDNDRITLAEVEVDEKRELSIGTVKGVSELSTTDVRHLGTDLMDGLASDEVPMDAIILTRNAKPTGYVMIRYNPVEDDEDTTSLADLMGGASDEAEDATEGTPAEASA